MKKLKSAFVLPIIVISLSILFFFIPFDEIFTKLPVIRTFYQNTTLEITTPNGKASVKIDGKEYGETPSNIQNLTSGKYSIELSRTSSQEEFYKPHIFNIELTKNTTSRINMEIGSGDNLHGVIIYYIEDSVIEKGKGKITTTSNTDYSKVYINDEYLKDTPVTNIEFDTGEYNIKLRSDGFQDLEFPVIVREGYILNIKGYQFPIPVIFDSIEDNE